MTDTPISFAEICWTALGVGGGIVFFSRFVVQWIASERQGRSVVPPLFWYLSVVGSLGLFAYAVYLRSPLGALSQTFNGLIYGRNLIHLWREEGVPSKGRENVVHLVIVLFILVAMMLTGLTWVEEYQTNQELRAEQARQNWVWIGVGLVGQGLYASRFLIQWVVTERTGKSVIPDVFWYLSAAAALLMGASYTQRQEWVFAAGMGVALLIYLRNIWFVRSANALPEPGCELE